jgi:hypothetical protein
MTPAFEIVAAGTSIPDPVEELTVTFAAVCDSVILVEPPVIEGVAHVASPRRKLASSPADGAGTKPPLPAALAVAPAMVEGDAAIEGLFERSL